MFFLIPYKIAIERKVTPWMNYLFVCVNIILFIGIRHTSLIKHIDRFLLDGWTVTGILGYMWLHASYFHLLSNLIILWFFGNALCSQIGNSLYLVMYLFSGVFAAITQLLLDGRGPSVGASGVLSAIIITLFFLFPYRKIQFRFFLTILPIGKGSMRICWFMAITVINDIIGAILFLPFSKISYLCHIGGTIAGFLFIYPLIKLNIVKPANSEKELVRSCIDKGD